MSGPRGREKRRRENANLAGLLGDGSVSLESIRRFLEHARDGEIPTGSRHQILSVYKERLQHVLHSEMVVDVDGDPHKWSFCDPGRLVQYLVETCPRLQDIYARAANNHRGEWSCIVTFDEVVPGDKLKTNNYRKSMSLCFSFMELGRRCLVIPCVWMFPVFTRSLLYNMVEGGWSNFLRIFLRRLFLCANSLQTTGVPLMLHGEPFLLKASLKHLISDGDGLRSGLNWKGANSLRPCFKHWNCTKKDSTVLAHSAELVDITCTDHRRFKVQTERMLDDNIAVVKAASQRLAAGGMTKTMYDTICSSKGLTYNKYGLLWDPPVRRLVTIKVVTMDWVHTTLCDGIFSCECHLLLKRSEEKVEKGFDAVRAFLVGWEFPSHRKTNMELVTRIFTDFRHAYAENHDKMKASASELLCVYGLLRHWVLLHLQDECLSVERESFNECCQVVDVMLRTKHGEITMANGARLLREATTRFLDTHIACYGTAFVRPKHHWPFDIAEQWQFHDFVPDAFLIEKEHLVARVVADRVDNTSNFEESVLAGVLNSQVKSLNSMSEHFEIMGNAAPYPGLPHSIVADNVSIDGVCMAVSDFVFFHQAPGKVVACVQEGDDFSIVVDALSVRSRLSANAAIYAFQGRRAVWDAKRVTLALAWRQSPDYAGCHEIILR